MPAASISAMERPSFPPSEQTPRRLHQGLDLALVVALARTAEAVSELLTAKAQCSTRVGRAVRSRRGKFAVDGPLLVVARGGGCTAWSFRLAVVDEGLSHHVSVIKTNGTVERVS